jgi:hypothetical protein
MFNRRPHATAAGLMLTVALIAAPTASAAPAPVALKSLAASPAAVTAGGVVTAKAVVSARRGAHVARSVSLRYVLSRDARASRDDRVLATVAVGRVRGGKSVQRRTAVRVPAAVRPGRYRLVGCVGSACRSISLSVSGTPAPSGGQTQTTPAPVSGPTPTTTTEVPAPDPLTPADPRSVAPVADPANATTATIGTAGGTLTATGADGSSFTLTIPVGALAGDIAITLTPVASVGGLPLSGGAAAAVDIAPDGLALMKPATLAIAPANAPATADQRGFSWHDDASHEVYLRDLAPKAAIEMTLEHFSGYGVGSGAPTAAWTPSRALDRIEQSTAQYLIAERNRVLAGGEPDPSLSTQITNLLVAEYDLRVKPRMQAAETDEHLATSAIQLGYGWARQAAILGSSENPDPQLASRSAEVDASVRRILRYAFDRTVEKCMAGEPAYAQRLVAFERWSQILGYGLPDGLEKARQCLSFQLTVDATDDVNYSFESYNEHVVVDHMPVRVDATDFVARGSQQLTFPAWNASGGANGCTIEPAGVDTDTFTVNSLTMQFNLFTELGPDGRETDVILPPDITLKVNPGLPHEHVLAHCPKGDSQILDINIWLLSWAVLEQPRLDPSNGDYTFTQLQTTGDSAPWAQATFDLTSGMVHQHLEFRLDHTPGA